MANKCVDVAIDIYTTEDPSAYTHTRQTFIIEGGDRDITSILDDLWNQMMDQAEETAKECEGQLFGSTELSGLIISPTIFSVEDC